MWELIRINKLKSVLLFIGLGLCLILFFSSIGFYIGNSKGAVISVFIAFILWFIFTIISMIGRNSLKLQLEDTKLVNKRNFTQVFNVVDEISIAANLPASPNVIIIPERSPNAYTVGTSIRQSVIILTAGLIVQMNRDELQGVVAHEIAHIINQDVQFMSNVRAIYKVATFIPNLMVRPFKNIGKYPQRSCSGGYYGGGGSGISGGSGGGGAGCFFFLFIFVIFLITGIVAKILYMSISKTREYLADACAARLTRYPEGLASALEKISESYDRLYSADKITAPMFIVNPLENSDRSFSGSSNTHPPTYQRIKILRQMSHGASYIDYQNAYSQVTGKSKRLIPSSGIMNEHNVKIREGTSGKGQAFQSNKKLIRNINDFIMAINNYTFINCSCGLKLKLPQNFTLSNIVCPRCGLLYDITSYNEKEKRIDPENEEQNVEVTTDKEPFIYKRTMQKDDWETFTCPCGKPKQIAPNFNKPYFYCNKCGRKIIVVD